MNDDVRSASSNWFPLSEDSIEDELGIMLAADRSRSSDGDRIVVDSFTEDSDLLREDDLDDYGNILPLDIDKRLLVRKIRDSGTPLVHLLQAHDAGMHVIAQFLRLKITMPMLMSLTDVDLQHLGVHCEETRKQMLDDFKQLPNQEKCFQNSDIVDPTTHNKTLLGNVFKNLLNLKCALSEILLHLYQQPTETVQINRRLYNAGQVLSTLDELSRTVFEMEARLQKLQHCNQSVLQEANDPSSVALLQKQRASSRSLWLAIAGTAAIFSFCVWRCWRPGPAVQATSFHNSYMRWY